MMKKENVLVIAAHNDDSIIGAGGTLAKYAREGKRITEIILSFGEGSHVWLKKEITIRMRVGESQKASKFLGIEKSYYLGLNDSTFIKNLKKKNIRGKIKRIIGEIKPDKIFTHARDDPHPHHKATNLLVKQAIDELGYACDVYSFDIWNPIRIKERNKPRMVVDVSKTFKRKIDAFKKHKSQKITMVTLLWNIYLKAVINGLKNNFKYAEVFYKIR
jgi:N-acetylglucosamine malate deacetylase 1